MNKDLICLKCDKKNDCADYAMVEGTLNNKKKHMGVSLTLDFIIAVDNPLELVEDMQEDISIQIVEQAKKLSDFILEQFESYNHKIMSLGADLQVGEITNKEAFENMIEYIKESHEQTSN